MDLLYLSSEDIRTLSLCPSELADSLVGAFCKRRLGEAILPAKTGMRPGWSDAFFHAMPAALQGGLSGIKWVAGARGNAELGLPHIMGLLILADGQTGKPLAIMESGELTGLRTAAMSLLAARSLARSDSTRIAFIGCGLQARTHLAALAAEFPIRRLHAVSRSDAGAERFCRHAAALGFEAQTCREPRQALADADIVVSTVPASTELKPFLDGRWMAPGGFATMVDLGRSWTVEGMAGFDRIFTDDREQTLALKEHSPLFGAVCIAGDLGDLLTGEAPGRSTPQERLAFAFPGAAIADLAAGNLALEKAREHGLGRYLPL